MLVRRRFGAGSINSECVQPGGGFGPCQPGQGDYPGQKSTVQACCPDPWQYMQEIPPSSRWPAGGCQCVINPNPASNALTSPIYSAFPRTAKSSGAGASAGGASGAGAGANSSGGGGLGSMLPLLAVGAGVAIFLFMRKGG